MRGAQPAPRVLVSGVVLGQPMGGVRRHAAELLPRAAARLAARGGSLCLLEGTMPVPFDPGPGVGWVRARVAPGPVARRWLGEGRALRAATTRALAAGRPFDLLHTGHLPLAAGGLPAVLVIHDLRDLEPGGSRGPRRLLAPLVLRHAVDRAREVIAVSRTVRDELRARFGLRRVRLVPNGGDHLPVLPRRRPQRPYLLHVGHLEPRKNLRLLLEVLARDPTLPELVLAGAPKAGEDARLLARARALGVDARLRLAGPVSDAELGALYAGASCVVLPARVEGFGIAVLEAQRAGAPLAVARAGALPEVAGHAVPCFAPDDAAGALAAVRRALATGEPALAAARARADAYRWDRSARALVAVWLRAARPRA